MPSTPTNVAAAVLLGAAVVAAAGCGGDEAAQPGGADDVPTVVVSTSILGDVVRQVVGDAAEVEVLMPLGADPHEFEPSAQQAEAMGAADLLVTNGAGFEEGLVDSFEAAEEAGVATFAFADHVTLLQDDEHAGGDPHLWTDPTLVARGVEALGDDLAALEGIDAAAVREGAAAYAEELRLLDAEIETILADIPDERRVLVTNHEVLTYFAERYDFELVGAIIPGGTTLAEPSSAELEALAELITSEGVPAIFAETTASTDLADALADAVGDEVSVETLFTESLGEDGSGAETYVDMLRLDARIIRDALA